MRRLAPGSAVFILNLLAKARFRQSAERAAAADPRFDLVTSLAELLVSRVIVELSRTASRSVADM
jgi:hypothetical protein